MKIAIVYTTVGGTTKECAYLLARQLDRHQVTVADMKENIDICEYDVVVLGFSVRMGRAAKDARRYIKQNRDLLMEKKVGYFICCGFVDCFDDYRDKLIPKELRARAIEISCFGGSLEPSRFGGIDKMIVRTVRSEILGGGDNGDQRRDMSLPTIMDENIAQFADVIKQMGEKIRW